MFIARIPNRNSPPAFLLRESYRDHGKVKTRTLANLSKLPATAIEVLQRALKGEQLVPLDQTLDIVASSHHGHVEAVARVLRQLGLARLIDSRPSHERDLVLAMITARILAPGSKLATTRCSTRARFGRCHLAHRLLLPAEESRSYPVRRFGGCAARALD